MPGYTPWTAVITSGSEPSDVRPAILSWLNQFQNSSPGEGELQKEYGLYPDGTVYQYLYAFIISVDASAPAQTTSDSFNDFGVLFSDRAATKLGVPLGTSYVRDLSFGTNTAGFIDQATLDAAIAGVEMEEGPQGPPGPTVPATEIVKLALQDESFRMLLAAELDEEFEGEAFMALVTSTIAKIVMTSLDPDQIRAQASAIALEQINAQQIYNEVVTQISNMLLSGDDIVSSANLALFRTTVTGFETKLEALQDEVDALKPIEETQNGTD